MHNHKPPTPTPTPLPPVISSRKKALCTGINDYPGTNNDLQGCVKDANDWTQLLTNQYNFKVTTLLNRQVTIGAFTETLGNFIADSKPGDQIVVTYSGHGCFSGDTKISLLDGRTLSMEELTEQYGGGGHFWVYSATPDGKIVPGKAHSPRITGTKKTILVTLDNGEIIKCTPEHLFMLRDGSYRQAILLNSGDSLMPLYRRNSSFENGDGIEGYDMCYVPSKEMRSNMKERGLHSHCSTGGYVYTHQLVAFSQGDFEKGKVIHHKNFNKKDNTPSNLKCVSRKEHAEIHSQTEESKAANRTRMIERNKKYEWPEHVRRKVGEISSFNRKREWENPSYREKITSSLKLAWQKCSELEKKNRVNGMHLFTRSEESEERKVASFKKTISDRRSSFYQTSHSIERKQHLDNIRQIANHKRWHVNRNVLVESCPLCCDPIINHKVIKIEMTENVEKVYDISVDEYHNFALSCGIFVHNSNVPDQNGDEDDGRDEAICLYDGFLIDDSIRELFQKIHPETFLTFISDSCHSGTVTRAFLEVMNQNDCPRPRYMPPRDDKEAFNVKGTNISKRIFLPESDMKEILIAGCLPTEYSYDAHFGNSFNGAMTYHAVNVLKQFPKITYENFFAKLRERLPSNAYPQTPQLEGSDENKKRIMFE